MFLLINLFKPCKVSSHSSKSLIKIYLLIKNNREFDLQKRKFDLRSLLLWSMKVLNFYPQWIFKSKKRTDGHSSMETRKEPKNNWLKYLEINSSLFETPTFQHWLMWWRLIMLKWYYSSTKSFFFHLTVFFFVYVEGTELNLHGAID